MIPKIRGRGIGFQQKSAPPKKVAQVVTKPGS